MEAVILQTLTPSFLRAQIRWRRVTEPQCHSSLTETSPNPQAFPFLLTIFHWWKRQPCFWRFFWPLFRAGWWWNNNDTNPNLYSIKKQKKKTPAPSQSHKPSVFLHSRTIKSLSTMTKMLHGVRSSAWSLRIFHRRKITGGQMWPTGTFFPFFFSHFLSLSC